MAVPAFVAQLPQKSADLRALEKLGNLINSPINSQLDLIRITRVGVAPDAVEALINQGFSRRDVSWIVPPRTLSHRHAKHENLTAEESGRLLRAGKIQALAEEVLGSRELAQSWLNKPRQAFAGLSAMEAMQTEAGGQLIEDTLNQLDTGYFA